MAGPFSGPPALPPALGGFQRPLPGPFRRRPDAFVISKAAGVTDLGWARVLATLRLGCAPAGPRPGLDAVGTPSHARAFSSL